MRSLFIQWIRVTSTWLCIAQNIQLLPTHKLKIIQINRLSCESQFKLGPEPGQDLSPNGVLRRENASEKINTYLSPYEKQKVCVCVCVNIRKFHWQLISLSIITARLWILWYSWSTNRHTRCWNRNSVKSDSQTWGVRGNEDPSTFDQCHNQQVCKIIFTIH